MRIFSSSTPKKVHKLDKVNLLNFSKKIYENSIKPLEGVYKYKELSNRHFGDPEIFNKPLIVMMGPWSGGKSTMINYILGNEFSKNAFRSSKQHIEITIILISNKNYSKIQ